MLEFSLHGTGYRVTRVPEHQRPKKRGDGFTTAASSVHLEQAGGRPLVQPVLEQGRGGGGGVITEAIGLNREQFTQVMLLPQGEFARFLRARDDDRRELLTKLFGTQLYDRITAELDRWRYDAARLREEAEQAVSAAVSAAAEAANLDAIGRTELLSLSRADRETRLKEESASLAETVAVTGEGLEVAMARVTAERVVAEQVSRQALLMARLTEALAALSEHERTRPEHDLRAARLAAARRADPVRSLLSALAEAEAATDEARHALLRQVPGTDEDALADRDGQETARRADAKDAEAASLQRLAGLESAVPGRRVTLAELDQAAAIVAGLVSDLEARQAGSPRPYRHAGGRADGSEEYRSRPGSSRPAAVSHREAERGSEPPGRA